MLELSRTILSVMLESLTVCAHKSDTEMPKVKDGLAASTLSKISGGVWEWDVREPSHGLRSGDTGHRCMTSAARYCSRVCERAFARLALAVLGWSRAAKGPWKAAFVARASWELKAHAQGLVSPRFWEQSLDESHPRFIKHTHTHTRGPLDTYAVNVVWRCWLISKFGEKRWACLNEMAGRWRHVPPFQFGAAEVKALCQQSTFVQIQVW